MTHQNWTVVTQLCLGTGDVNLLYLQIAASVA